MEHSMGSDFGMYAFVVVFVGFFLYHLYQKYIGTL